MTNPDATTPPKRLFILDDEEIEALYARPCFTIDARPNGFALTQPEKIYWQPSTKSTFSFILSYN